MVMSEKKEIKNNNNDKKQSQTKSSIGSRPSSSSSLINQRKRKLIPPSSDSESSSSSNEKNDKGKVRKNATEGQLISSSSPITRLKKISNTSTRTTTKTDINDSQPMKRSRATNNHIESRKLPVRASTSPSASNLQKTLLGQKKSKKKIGNRQKKPLGLGKTKKDSSSSDSGSESDSSEVEIILNRLTPNQRTPTQKAALKRKKALEPIQGGVSGGTSKGISQKPQPRKRSSAPTSTADENNFRRDLLEADIDRRTLITSSPLSISCLTNKSPSQSTPKMNSLPKPTTIMPQKSSIGGSDENEEANIHERFKRSILSAFRVLILECPKLGADIQAYVKMVESAANGLRDDPYETIFQEELDDKENSLKMAETNLDKKLMEVSEPIHKNLLELIHSTRSNKGIDHPNSDKDFGGSNRESLTVETQNILLERTSSLSLQLESLNKKLSDQSGKSENVIHPDSLTCPLNPNKTSSLTRSPEKFSASLPPLSSSSTPNSTSTTTPAAATAKRSLNSPSNNRINLPPSSHKQRSRENSYQLSTLNQSNNNSSNNQLIEELIRSNESLKKRLNLLEKSFSEQISSKNKPKSNSDALFSKDQESFIESKVIELCKKHNRHQSSSRNESCNDESENSSNKFFRDSQKVYLRELLEDEFKNKFESYLNDRLNEQFNNHQNSLNAQLKTQLNQLQQIERDSLRRVIKRDLKDEIDLFRNSTKNWIREEVQVKLNNQKTLPQQLAEVKEFLDSSIKMNNKEMEKSLNERFKALDKVSSDRSMLIKTELINLNESIKTSFSLIDQLKQQNQQQRDTQAFQKSMIENGQDLMRAELKDRIEQGLKEMELKNAINISEMNVEFNEFRIKLKSEIKKSQMLKVEEECERVGEHISNVYSKILQDKISTNNQSLKVQLKDEILNDRQILKKLKRNPSKGNEGEGEGKDYDKILKKLKGELDKSNEYIKFSVKEDLEEFRSVLKKEVREESNVRLRSSVEESYKTLAELKVKVEESLRSIENHQTVNNDKTSVKDDMNLLRRVGMNEKDLIRDKPQNERLNNNNKNCEAVNRFGVEVEKVNDKKIKEMIDRSVDAKKSESDKKFLELIELHKTFHHKEFEKIYVIIEEIKIHFEENFQDLRLRDCNFECQLSGLAQKFIEISSSNDQLVNQLGVLESSVCAVKDVRCHEMIELKKEFGLLVQVTKDQLLHLIESKFNQSINQIIGSPNSIASNSNDKPKDSAEDKSTKRQQSLGDNSSQQISSENDVARKNSHENNNGTNNQQESSRNEKCSANLDQILSQTLSNDKDSNNQVVTAEEGEEVEAKGNSKRVSEEEEMRRKNREQSPRDLEMIENYLVEKMLKYSAREELEKEEEGANEGGDEEEEEGEEKDRDDGVGELKRLRHKWRKFFKRLKSILIDSAVSGNEASKLGNSCKRCRSEVGEGKVEGWDAERDDNDMDMDIESDESRINDADNDGREKEKEQAKEKEGENIDLKNLNLKLNNIQDSLDRFAQTLEPIQIEILKNLSS